MVYEITVWLALWEFSQEESWRPRGRRWQSGTYTWRKHGLS